LFFSIFYLLFQAYAAQSAAASEGLAAKVLSARASVRGNPFGDFAAMVDVCMEMAAGMASMFAAQLGLLNQMFDDIMGLAADEAALGASVASMAGDVAWMASEVGLEEQLMLDVTDCMEGK
jgi:hypothetical protein